MHEMWIWRRATEFRPKKIIQRMQFNVRWRCGCSIHTAVMNLSRTNCAAAEPSSFTKLHILIDVILDLWKSGRRVPMNLYCDGRLTPATNQIVDNCEVFQWWRCQAWIIFVYFRWDTPYKYSVRMSWFARSLTESSCLHVRRCGDSLSQAYRLYIAQPHDLNKPVELRAAIL